MQTYKQSVKCCIQFWELFLFNKVLYVKCFDKAQNKKQQNHCDIRSFNWLRDEKQCAHSADNLRALCAHSARALRTCRGVWGMLRVGCFRFCELTGSFSLVLPSSGLKLAELWQYSCPFVSSEWCLLSPPACCRCLCFSSSWFRRSTAWKRWEIEDTERILTPTR